MPKISDDEEAIICFECGKKEDKPNKVIECAFCHRSVHFQCKNISGNAIPKVRKQPYYCTEYCQVMQTRASQTTNADPALLTRILNEVSLTREDVQSMKNTVKAIEASQSFLSSKFDELANDVRTLKTDHSQLSKDVDVLLQENQSVCSRVNELELELDRVNRAVISANAILVGLPMLKNEDTLELVKRVATAINCNIPDGAVVEAKRLSSKNKKDAATKTTPIKITFTDVKYKEHLFACKKTHGQLLQTAVDPRFTNTTGKVILRDELTSFGMNLLSESRGTQALIEYKFIWPGRDGAILARKTEDSKIVVIRSKHDLQQLERLNTKRQRNISGHNSPSNSSQQSKRSAII